MAVEHVLVQRFKKKEMGEKKLLTKLLKCYEASKFLYKNNLAKSLFWIKTNFKNLNIRSVFRTQSNISDGLFLGK